MEYRILGPLEVLEDGRPVALGNLKERMVLGVLLLHANAFVSRERLIDELWGVAPPPTARKAVNVYLSKVRKTLGGAGRDPIATADGGYRLVLDGDSLDSERARTLLAGARDQVAAGDAPGASRLFQEALELWRGPTLAGLPLESVGRDEVAQLDELRLTGVMDRIDCDLALGRHEDVLGELQVLVREEPLRERLRAQLMLALYRSDRQADALDAFHEARRDLIEELGIEPSESLQRLQQAILRHDPALETPTGTATANGAPLAPAAAEAPALAMPPSRPRAPRGTFHRRYLFSAGLALLAVVAALVAYLSLRGGSPPSPSSPVSYTGSNTSVVIDPSTDKFAPGPGGGHRPGPMAVVGNKLWTLIRGSAAIGVYDLRTKRESPPFSAGTSPYAIVADANGAFVSQRKPVVTWIRRPLSYETDHPYATPVAPTRNIPVPLPGAGAEAYGGGYVWVIPGPLSPGNRVALIDVRHGRFRRTIQLGPGLQTSAIAYGYGAAWIATWDPQHSTAYLERVGLGSRPVAQKLENGDGAGPLAVAVGDRSVWVVTSRGNLLGVDPNTLETTHQISMPDAQPKLLAVVAGSVWTANHRGYSVSKIDPRANEVVRTIPLGSYRAVPCGITATHGSVVVAFGESSCG